MKLANDEVQVWRAALDLAPHRLAQLNRMLTPDERERAARFRFARDRLRFVAARGVLRELLARCLGCEASALRFSYGPRGKPALAGSPGNGLRFNVSHSAGTALFALALGREVGVDLEALQQNTAHADIAGRFFSQHERDALDALPGAARPLAFLRCWTRKEAFIKATGDGLSFPLDRFDVALDERHSALLAVHDEPQATERWLLRDLPAGYGFVAALAAERRDWRLRMFNYDIA